MLENDDASGGDDKDTQQSQKGPKVSRSRLVIGFGALLFVLASIALILVAVYFVNEHSARIKFGFESFFSLLVLAVIISQACIYWKQREWMERQWKAMENQTRIMDDSLVETRKLVAQNERFSRINSRAYVFIETSSLDAPIRSGKFPLPKIVFKNSGQTPAYNHRVRIEQAFLDGESLENAKKGIMPEMRGLNKKGLGIIGANQFVHLQVQRGEWESFKAQSAAMKGSTIFYIWGVVRYSDIFGKEHSSKFSLYARNPRVTSLSYGVFGNDFEDEETREEKGNADRDKAN